MKTSTKAQLFAAAFCVLGAFAMPAQADADGLRAKHVELREQLRNNNFQRAMHVDSSEANGMLQGDVYAVIDHPFSKVSRALKQPAAWCDIMLLPFNTKLCQPTNGGAGLHVKIGRKYNQPVEQAYGLDFGFRNVAANANYLETRLDAPQGPVGTRDYRIVVSAVPVEGGKTFMHMRYSYGYGTMGKLAMNAYLSTAGADKVGFSLTGKDANGKPQPIDGVRGAIERNAMRYYLAIDAYLDTMDLPPEQQVEKRIQAWFTATERYPRQLREMDRSTYAAMKRQEYERQTTASLN
ncbi:hypothetical protein [Ramlibacter sp.]|uniref:hypothetical protein n=1 Tax=Ramlibacter sp. TaxID=1917967 RepID=UPI003D109B45